MKSQPRDPRVQMQIACVICSLVRRPHWHFLPLFALTTCSGTAGEQAAVKASLTNCVTKEQDKSTRKKMADTTGEVASMVMEDDTEQWPEMFPFLFMSAKVSSVLTSSCRNLMPWRVFADSVFCTRLRCIWVRISPGAGSWAARVCPHHYAAPCFLGGLEADARPSVGVQVVRGRHAGNQSTAGPPVPVG